MSDPLTDALAALAHPSRREMLKRLTRVPVLHGSHLVTGFRCSRQALSRHLQLLELAGLVTSQSYPGMHVFELQADRFRLIDAWLEPIRTRLSAGLRTIELYSEQIDENDLREDP